MSKQNRDLIPKDKKENKASVTDGKNYLFVIGIDAYLHCPTLSNCVRDAQAVTAILQEQYNFESTRTTSLFDQNATRRNILLELDNFKTKIQKTDNLIIYFSGHGEFRHNLGHWVPYEAQPKYTGDFISTHDITSRLDEIESLHTFLIIDACFSGSFFAQRKMVSSLTDFSKPSRLGLSSSHSREIALDGRIGDNSPFASCIIQALKVNKEPLDAAEFGELVKDGVHRETGGKQSPIFRPIDVKGDDLGVFVFFPKDYESFDWKVALEQKNVKALLDFEKKYPNSVYLFSGELDLAIMEIEEDELWLFAITEDTISAYRQYRSKSVLKKYFDQAASNIGRLLSKNELILGDSVDILKPRKANLDSTEKPQIFKTNPRLVKEDNVFAMIEANMVFVKGGDFMMGSNDGKKSEQPVHLVLLDDFYLNKYPVTVVEFAQFIEEIGYQTDADKEGGSWFWDKKWEMRAGINWRYDANGMLRPKSEFNHPVIHVSWNDATEYCKWLVQKTNMAYCLPTEAQWEYAAQGGNSSEDVNHAWINNIDQMAWYNDNSDNKTHPVGKKLANNLGIYDMSGNVWEWCKDWYDEDYYSRSPLRNPNGPESGIFRVLRGGSWGRVPHFCRSFDRYWYYPGNRYNDIGFRLARY